MRAALHDCDTVIVSDATRTDTTDLATIVSGGISSLDDLRAILELAHPGIEGVIVGKALFDGRFQAREAAEILHGVRP